MNHPKVISERLNHGQVILEEINNTSVENHVFSTNY